jgi:hypothetical protein
MKALVVYESLYGNTARIGEAIADSLTANGVKVESGPIAKIDAAHAEAFDLVMIGGPTHAHGMSREETRETAVQDEKNTYAEPTASPGLREWMDGLPCGEGRMAAAFDTRIKAPAFLTGSAAKGIVHRLEEHGYALATEPESFLVTRQSELIDGEIEHATVWGARVAEAAAAGAARSR